MSPSSPANDLFASILQSVQQAPNIAQQATQAAVKKTLEDLRDENTSALNDELARISALGHDSRYRYEVAGFFGCLEFNPVSNQFTVPVGGKGYHGQPLFYRPATTVEEDDMYEAISLGRAYIQRINVYQKTTEVTWRPPHSMEAVQAFLKAVR